MGEIRSSILRSVAAPAWFWALAGLAGCVPEVVSALPGDDPTEAGDSSSSGVCDGGCEPGQSRCVDKAVSQSCLAQDGGCGAWGPDQPCEGGCANGACCTPNAHVACDEGDQYWFDSCWSRGELILECLHGCDGGQCLNPACTHVCEPETPEFTAEASYSCAGGITMEISGSIDDQDRVTVRVRRLDQKPFETGDYVVRVFDPYAPQQCASFNIAKATAPSGVGSLELTFEPFPSLLECSGSDKGYCVRSEATAECSGKLVVLNRP